MPKTLVLPSTVVFSLAAAFSPLQASDSIDNYLSLDLQELLSLEVTSVSKKKHKLGDSAAAIHVITNEDIRRSGVTSIPEALRLAPGILVARIDSNKWVVSSRGSGSQFANKLLVLIDGRTVYTPTYSGVYWEVQDVLLEDIDRIEVIRGPGATLWGANAVNGVINILTRSADRSQGSLVSVGAGDEEKAVVSLRQGFEFGDDDYGRVYAKFNARDSSYSSDLGGEAGDGWEKLQLGFRLDWNLGGGDGLTLQGDAYDADENQTLKNFYLDPSDPANQPPDPAHPFVIPYLEDNFGSTGYNLLLRWQRQTGADSSSLQVYFDHHDRQERVVGQRVDTLDIDFSQNLYLGERHDLVWGLGYRHINDRFNNTFRTTFYKRPETLELYNLYAQDRYTLRENLWLTAGVKWEHNDYTGLEIQPNLRLLWSPDERQSWWAAVSRAVHTPSRMEASSSILAYLLPPDPVDPNYPLPSPLRVEGNPDIKSEKLDAFELGYRIHPNDRLSLDATVFRYRYKDLLTFEQTGVQSFSVPDPYQPGQWIHLPTGIVYGNKRSATNHGAELSLDLQARENWRLKFNYSWLDLNPQVDSGSTDRFGDRVIEGSAPAYQWSLRSRFNIREDLFLDLWIYHVEKLMMSGYSQPWPIPAYNSFNLRLAGRSGRMEWSVSGFNLLRKRHAEFTAESIFVRSQVERSVLATLRWRF